MVTVGGDGVVPGSRSSASLEHESDLQMDPVAGDLAVFHLDRLVFHPRALDVLDGLAGLLDPPLDGILKAFGGLGADLDDFCDGHGKPPFELSLSHRLGCSRHARKGGAHSHPAGRCAGGAASPTWKPAKDLGSRRRSWKSRSASPRTTSI